MPAAPGKDRSSFISRYINFAQFLLSEYDGNIPFHHYLKNYFSKNRKHGSRDRKVIRSICYNYFRVANGVIPTVSFEEKIFSGIFLCEPENGFLYEMAKSSFDVPEIARLKSLVDPDHLFPLEALLSDNIDSRAYSRSFLVQPDLFLRIRPGFRKTLLEKFKSRSIPVEECRGDCLRLQPDIPVEKFVVLNRECVVQDLNSQKVGSFFRKYVSGNLQKVWDCCAGSGGKSLLLLDILPGIKLTVSDRRKSILRNLKERFRQANLFTEAAIEIDLTKDRLKPYQTFDVVIADVPCTGSGTWGRTPEIMKFFSPEKARQYAELQQQIVLIAQKNLVPGGVLFYITCSVFMLENEENVKWFEENTPLRCIDSTYLPGYEERADTLFIAILEKSPDN